MISLCAGFIANDDLHFVDCRGFFSLYETMEHFPYRAVNSARDGSTQRNARQRCISCGTAWVAELAKT
jgi:hypothetical protein